MKSKRFNMSTFNPLATKIKQDKGFDVTDFERIYTGIHQQSHVFLFGVVFTTIIHVAVR